MVHCMMPKTTRTLNNRRVQVILTFPKALGECQLVFGQKYTFEDLSPLTVHVHLVAGRYWLQSPGSLRPAEDSCRCMLGLNVCVCIILRRFNVTDNKFEGRGLVAFIYPVYKYYINFTSPASLYTQVYM